MNFLCKYIEKVASPNQALGQYMFSVNRQTIAYTDIAMGVKVSTLKLLIHKPAYSHHTCTWLNKRKYDYGHSYVSTAM